MLGFRFGSFGMGRGSWWEGRGLGRWPKGWGKGWLGVCRGSISGGSCNKGLGWELGKMKGINGLWMGQMGRGMGDMRRESGGVILVWPGGWSIRGGGFGGMILLVWPGGWLF